MEHHHLEAIEHIFASFLEILDLHKTIAQDQFSQYQKQIASSKLDLAFNRYLSQYNLILIHFTDFYRRFKFMQSNMMQHAEVFKKIATLIETKKASPELEQDFQRMQEIYLNITSNCFKSSQDILELLMSLIDTPIHFNEQDFNSTLRQINDQSEKTSILLERLHTHLDAFKNSEEYLKLLQFSIASMDVQTQ